MPLKKYTYSKVPYLTKLDSCPTENCFWRQRNLTTHFICINLNKDGELEVSVDG